MKRIKERIRNTRSSISSKRLSMFIPYSLDLFGVGLRTL
jgi:hypothetical protein